MNKVSPPGEERRALAVRTACKMLRACEVRTLPPDPERLAKELDFPLRTLTDIADELRENPDRFIRRTVGEEAFTISFPGEYHYLVVYDDTVRSPERIRFSILHEFGHILLGHFEQWDLTGMSPDQARALEDEANTFARNFLCPPPILDLVRGDWRDPKWAALFCMSERAWRARVRTMAIDRRFIDQRTADELRAQFAGYMFGRRCRDCGEVFLDVTRLGRCPKCGSRFLKWNPEMEDAAAALARRHFAGAAAEDLRPRVGEEKPMDLAKYWEMTVKERKHLQEGEYHA